MAQSPNFCIQCMIFFSGKFADGPDCAFPCWNATFIPQRENAFGTEFAFLPRNAKADPNRHKTNFNLF